LAKVGTYLRWGLAIIGLAIIVFVFFRYKQYILPVLAAIGAFMGYLFGKRTPKDPVSPADRKKEADAYKKIDDVKQQAAATDEKQQSLDQRIHDLEAEIDKRRKGGTGPLIIILAVLLLAGGTAWAAKGDLYIPTDYHELKKLYMEADKQVTESLDIIKALRQQITDLQKQRDEALQAAEELKQVNLDKDKIITDQQARLEHMNHQWGVSPGFQTSQGFTLGVSRRIDFFSVGLGVSSQGSIFGNCTIWF
jgi:hypothetical protein